VDTARQSRFWLRNQILKAAFEVYPVSFFPSHNTSLALTGGKPRTPLRGFFLCLSARFAGGLSSKKKLTEVYQPNPRPIPKRGPHQPRRR
jgi:hypothetical protein